jgi:hypothetical protein
VRLHVGFLQFYQLEVSVSCTCTVIYTRRHRFKSVTLQLIYYNQHKESIVAGSSKTHWLV